MGSHYRKELVFSYEGLEGAKSSYNKLINKINNLKDIGALNQEEIKKYQINFKDALSNDLNTSTAITVIFDVLKSDLNDNSKKYLIKEFDKVLSLSLIKQKEDKVNELENDYIISKIEERKKAKANKDYDKANAIRKELLSMNIELIDTRDGTKYKVID